MHPLDGFGERVSARRLFDNPLTAAFAVGLASLAILAMAFASYF